MARRERDYDEGYDDGYEDGFGFGLAKGRRERREGTRRGRNRSTATRRQSSSRRVKKTRKPSAYNRFMSKELKTLRRKHPRTAQATLFKRAAKSWKRKKGKR